MIWPLIGYMWMEIHRPFEVWLWLARLYVERWYMICVITYWLLCRPSLPRPNRLHWCFALFILVMLASWLTSPCGTVGNDPVEGYVKYAVFYFLLVANVRTDSGLRKIIAGYLLVMTLWMLHSLREYFMFGYRVWAQGLVRLIPVGHSYDFNDFAGLIVCSLPMAWLFWQHATTRRQRMLVGAYIGLAGYCVILTGSRMGFAGLVLAGLMASLASPRRWRYVALYPVVLTVLWAVLPEGSKDRYTTLFDQSYQSAAGASMGDFRYGAFQRGLEMCAERPLLGYGPFGFMVVGYHGMMAHNLYGQLLGELGIAGAVAFGAIVVGVFRNFFEARRIRPKVDSPESLFAWDAVGACLCSFVLLLVMSWGFNFLYWFVWLWFGGFQVVALQVLRQDAADLEMDGEELGTSQTECLE